MYKDRSAHIDECETLGMAGNLPMTARNLELAVGHDGELEWPSKSLLPWAVSCLTGEERMRHKSKCNKGIIAVSYETAFNLP